MGSKTVAVGQSTDLIIIIIIIIIIIKIIAYKGAI